MGCLLTSLNPDERQFYASLFKSIRPTRVIFHISTYSPLYAPPSRGQPLLDGGGVDAMLIGQKESSPIDPDRADRG